MRIAALLATTAILLSTQAYAGSCTTPSNFTPRQAIETKFSDFPAGRAAIYSDGEERSRVFVLPHFVKSGGIWWRAISDIGGEVDAGLLGEATIDLYAENKTGDVCYGGEWTSAFEYNESTENLVSIAGAGSFIHGFQGTAGTYMVANPVVGQTWTIESLDGGATSEVATVIALTSTRVTLRINHTEDGELTEVETKVFDNIGELSASVPGEPTSTRVSVVQQ